MHLYTTSYKLKLLDNVRLKTSLKYPAKLSDCDIFFNAKNLPLVGGLNNLLQKFINKVKSDSTSTEHIDENM